MVWISSLSVKDIRVIEQAEIQPVRGLNFVVGANGAGKTSVLEAIYLAGRGRSFRHPDAGPLIRKAAPFARVVVQLHDEKGERVGILGMERSRKDMRCRFEGRDLRKRSELADTLPIQFVSSQPQLLLSMGPEIRRRFLDLALFHVEHRYLPVFSQVQKALRQRNAALKLGVSGQVRVWDGALVEAGNELTSMRQELTQKLHDRASCLLQAWGQEFELACRYRQGWRKELGLADALSGRLVEDMERGFTSVGPQRADIEFVTDNGLAEKRLSRGQQKMMVLALNMAVNDLVAEASSGERRPVLLVDDLAAELDNKNVIHVLSAVKSRCLQAFVAMIDDPPANALADSEAKVFHVEHGEIK
jgi:DNA replication and repair protein RecF